MSSEEFEKYDDLNESSLDGKGSEELDEYGVWVKKRPDAPSDVTSSDHSLESFDAISNDSFDGGEDSDVEGASPENSSTDSEAFDFDGLDGGLSFSKDAKDVFDDALSEIEDQDLDDVDMSDFFTDFADDTSDDDVESEDTLKMDLNFDTVDSFAESDDGSDDFDAMFAQAEGGGSAQDSAPLTEDSFTQVDDDFLSSDLDSSSLASPSDSAPMSRSGAGDSAEISLDVNVDEEENFDKISDESSVFIGSPVDNDDGDQVAKTDDEDDVVVKNTVIEATNIDEIKSKNQEVLNDAKEKSSENAQKGSVPMEDFNDVDALAKDLATPSVHDGSALHCEGGRANVVCVEGLDKVQELLEGMARELTSIKEEIATLKNRVSFSDKGGVEVCQESIACEKEEESGFFKDEDTDEAIALTGDELNNILITADFTEEQAAGESIDENEGAQPEDSASEAGQIGDELEGKTEDAVGACEACGDDEKNIEDEDVEFDTERSEFEFDDIAIENSKLDDFVIPEELDYNMLRVEDEGDVPSDSGEAESTGVSDSDMAYLSEKESDDEDLPKTQELQTTQEGESSDDEVEDSLSCNVASTDSDQSVCSASSDEGGEVLPSNIKKDVKSVLAYMDQLLESLPEEKIKEFAESEYFEMYHRLFTDLGIS